MTDRRGRTLAILQARMSSSRLPGKVLAPIEGVPMVLRQLERVSRAATLDQIVVATSDDPSDDDLADLVTQAGYLVFRGDLHDVLARFIGVIDAFQPDVVVRLTADCPLISPRVIDLVVETFRAGQADYVSNTMKPTFPGGLDVEVVVADVLHSVADTSQDPDEREHVTLGVYRRVNEYAIENVFDPTGRDNSALRWTVDNKDDLVFVRQVFAELGSAPFDYDEVLKLLERNPSLNRTEADAPRNAALKGLQTGAMRFPGDV